MTHLTFEENSEWQGKTKKWFIHNEKECIGEIKWNGGWRQYVFDPVEDTIWSWDCLKEVHEFIKSRMDERKHG